MTTLTIAAIRENPWNAVYQRLPSHPNPWFVRAAFYAAEYCSASELEFIHFALANPFSLEAQIIKQLKVRCQDADDRAYKLSKIHQRFFGDPLDKYGDL